MNLNPHLLAAALFVAAGVSAVGQNNDPFGDGLDDDPFKDPLNRDDPFYTGGREDPFAYLSGTQSFARTPDPGIPEPQLARPLPPVGDGVAAVQLEYIEAEHQVIRELLLNATGDGMRRTLHDLIGTGEARLVSMGGAVAAWGHPARLTAATEWRYPIEFDTPELPMELVGPIDPKTDFITNITPTAFDLRNVGWVAAFAPAMGNRHGFVEPLSLDLIAELNGRTGDVKWGQGEAVLVQPNIYPLRDVLWRCPQRGHWRVLGIHTPPDDGQAGDRRVVSLVQVVPQGYAAPGKPGDPFAAETMCRFAIEFIEVPAAEAVGLLNGCFAGASANQLRTPHAKLKSPIGGVGPPVAGGHAAVPANGSRRRRRPIGCLAMEAAIRPNSPKNSPARSIRRWR
ncbi:MAG: hypothetical protein R3F11_19890 [Verrucomicrobiales bacterium]